MDDEVRVRIDGDADLVSARAEARAMAERLGFARPAPTLIATAISEIARNIVVHVGRGERNAVLEDTGQGDSHRGVPAELAGDGGDQLGHRLRSGGLRGGDPHSLVVQ